MTDVDARAGQAEQAGQAGKVRVSTIRNAAVLVVDDDPDQRFLMGRRLSSAGMRVTTAATGDEAIAGVDGVDLVLLDYRLGARDGLEVLAELRELPDPPAVVMVTAMGSEEVAVASMHAGASDYLVKDGHQFLKRLPTVVERALRHHDLERRARELQRLALLVTSAPDRDVALAEIVAGAMRLLAADRCELLLADSGDDGGASDAVAATAGALPDGVVVLEELRVPVSMPDTGRLGELVVRRAEQGPFSEEETRLASTFAGFAAITMAKLHQLELERALVSELQRTLEMRRQLVAGVSHELRTPLTAISGFAQTMLTHWDRLPEGERRDIVGRILANANDLASLVEQLLEFASAEAGRLHAELYDIDLSMVVAEAVADLGPLLIDRTVVVDVADGTHARADKMIVRRLLYNLITNAVKYTPADAAIAVRATLLGGGGFVRVEVADTGDGLSPEEAAHVFEPFWRAEATRQSQRGTGIGLALVHDYARLLGGDAGVETAPGEGATFWFTLRT